MYKVTRNGSFNDNSEVIERGVTEEQLPDIICGYVNLFNHIGYVTEISPNNGRVTTRDSDGNVVSTLVIEKE